MDKQDIVEELKKAPAYIEFIKTHWKLFAAIAVVAFALGSCIL